MTEAAFPTPNEIQKRTKEIRANRESVKCSARLAHRGRSRKVAAVCVTITPEQIVGALQLLRFQGMEQSEVAAKTGLPALAVRRIADGSFRSGIGYIYRVTAKESRFFGLQSGRCAECGSVAYVHDNGICDYCILGMDDE